jgi:predicted nuclease of restriction endonuclease-like (RecB) superfamily
MGVGFAFVGSRFPFEIGGEGFNLDLPLYHLKLRCFVVIDLKVKVAFSDASMEPRR